MLNERGTDHFVKVCVTHSAAETTPSLMFGTLSVLTLV